MRTFDEAVDAAFAVKRVGQLFDDAEVQEMIQKKGDAQIAFQHDIMANPVIMDSLERLALSLANDMVALDQNAPGSDLAATVVTHLLSSFQWGLAVGRKMEEQDHA